MFVNSIPRWVSHLQQVDVEDLQYIESDLCFYELVSLGFLLFGDERDHAGFVLQKLLVLSQNRMRMGHHDLLRQYATINPKNWRTHLVEALTIIGARHVLRKLGFQWDEMRQHFLPNVCELSVHVHPMIKALYKMCERLTKEQAGHLVEHLNRQPPGVNFNFSDSLYLEIFLLDWITRRIITVGDRELRDADIQVLCDYTKLNELDELKELLMGTIRHNARPPLSLASLIKDSKTSHDSSLHSPKEMPVASPVNISSKQIATRNCGLEPNECYMVQRETAGIALIINQRNFHEETSEELRHLLPTESLQERLGTDVDKERLKEVFTTFGYIPETFDNLGHIEMLHRIRETVKRSFRFNSLIVCILSHGVDGAVYGCNSIAVDIAEIQQIITGDEIKQKPKMIIIQACQIDKGPKTPTKIVSKRQKSTEDKKPSASTFISADAFTDIIVAMSTVPGYPAMRNTVTGTWFIQSLCDTLHRLGDNKHMLDILVAVTRDVAQKRGASNELMVPITTNTLTKYFFLPRREEATYANSTSSSP